MTNPDPWHKLYDLRYDEQLITGLQNHIRDSQRAWFTPPLVHGLIGSPEWWLALETGQLSVNRREFLITRKEEIEGERMSELIVTYEIEEGGQCGTWGHPDGEMNREYFEPGDRVRLDSVPVEHIGQTTLAIWKQSPQR
jgi:hypothetical protein